MTIMKQGHVSIRPASVSEALIGKLVLWRALTGDLVWGRINKLHEEGAFIDLRDVKDDMVFITREHLRVIIIQLHSMSFLLKETQWLLALPYLSSKSSERVWFDGPDENNLVEMTNTTVDTPVAQLRNLLTPYFNLVAMLKDGAAHGSIESQLKIMDNMTIRKKLEELEELFADLKPRGADEEN